MNTAGRDIGLLGVTLCAYLEAKDVYAAARTVEEMTAY